MEIPSITRDQMIEVDRLMVDEMGVTLLQMMENAGGAIAEYVIDHHAPRTALVVAGAGGNGGGALVAARHLSNRGVGVVVLRASDRLKPATEKEMEILRSMGVLEVNAPIETDLVIDGMIGYSLAGEPTGRAGRLIDWMNAWAGPVISVDVPSGADPDLGFVHEKVVHPEATITVALPKPCLIDERCGVLGLADISVPRTVWRRMGLAVPAGLFGGNRLVHLGRTDEGFVVSEWEAHTLR